ncbi:MAG TPA: 50S ribosomal protein L5, partial [Nitrososphaeraceae archaeon]
MSKVNNMKLIKLEKVVINIGVGKSGEPLERAKSALEELTSRKPTQCGAKDNVRDFGIHKGEPIGAKVTLRNTEAMEFAKRIIQAKNNQLKK